MSVSVQLPAATDDERLSAIVLEINTINSGAYFETGRRLAEAKVIHGRNKYPGGFEGWVRDNLIISYTSARRCVQVFENLGEQLPTFGQLSQAAAEAVSTADEEIKAIVAEKIEAGELVTAAEVTALKKDHLAAVRRAVEEVAAEADKKVTEATAEVERLRALVDQSATDEERATEEAKRLGKELEAAEKARDKATKELEKLKAKSKPKEEPPKPADPLATPSPLDHLLDLMVLQLMPIRRGSIDQRLNEIGTELRRRMENNAI